jgi:predicted glycosyltransferase
MNILVDINHPAHFHLFKFFILDMKEKGHNVFITGSDKDITYELLTKFNLNFFKYGKLGKTFLEKAWRLLIMDLKMIYFGKKNKIDLFFGMGSIRAAHSSFILSKKSFIFEDTENFEQINLYKYFSSYIFTPNCFKKYINKKQIRYPGYHELAYLHPNRFTPDISVLNLLNVAEEEKYVIMRFVSWDATHDNGQKGFTDEMKLKAVKEFSKYAKVFITSEKQLNGELDKFRIKIPPEKIHDAINYCSLLFGESATMASEAAVLGVPAIYLDYIGRGYTDEQEKKYGLVFNFKNSIEEQEKAIIKGIELLSDPNTKSIWAEKRKKMLEEKIDVTEYIVNLIENFQKTGKI